MAERFVGFYWTLPVPWRRDRNPSNDPDQAAKRSRTIRYQVELTRRRVREARDVLVGEIAFTELKLDRGTADIKTPLAKAHALCLKHRAKLLYVNFAAEHYWRGHPHLHKYLLEHDVPCATPLDPDEITLSDGQTFRPYRHFRRWREIYEARAAELRGTALTELTATAARHVAGPGAYRAISDELNGRGVLSTTGRLWTAESVRKRMDRHDLAFARVSPRPPLLGKGDVAEAHVPPA